REYKQDNQALDGTHFGFVAQEVKDVIPEMVTETIETFDGDTIEDFHLLDSGKLIPLLVQAVKELKTENESLKKRLDSLENDQKTTNLDKGDGK
ncbi:MAG: tail fiber domain-containing protein, partial [Planctomycetes bacterium]|nr:tail fiber domain-containing protein [Planctomycetota bacterium]